MKILCPLLVPILLCACTREITQPPATPEIRSQNGDRIGNGGGAWVCSEPSGDIRWIELVDLFEAEKEFKLKVPRLSENQDFAALVDFKREWLFQHAPALFAQLDPYLANVARQAELVEADLEIVNDALYRIKPDSRSCASGRVEYAQIANFTNYGKVLINSRLWENPKLSANARAALLFHEAVYQWLREKAKDRNSVRTRTFTGYLFSTLYPREMRAALDRILRQSGDDPRAQASALPLRADRHYVRFESLKWFGNPSSSWEGVSHELSFSAPVDGSWKVKFWPLWFPEISSGTDLTSAVEIDLRRTKDKDVDRWRGTQEMVFTLPNGEVCGHLISVEVDLQESGLTARIRSPRHLKAQDSEEISAPNGWTCNDFEEASFLSLATKPEAHD